MTNPFRHSICNEVFEKWDFAESCKAIRNAGYSGIEIAHFTLAEDPATISAAQRKEYRDIIASEGLEFVGLHWLMVSPKGLHVTTPDNELRRRSWQHIGNLIDLCADLGENGIMVFGSPVQRNSTAGLTPGQATRNWVEGFRSIAKHAEDRGVAVLVEALPRAQSDVCNTLEEAVAIVREVNSPAIRTMFDTHNAADEKEPHAVVLDRHFDYVRHIHVNEMDGRYAGTGDYDFKSIFRVLRDRDYSGWVSLEVFDFKPDAVTIANKSLRYLEQQIQTMDQAAEAR